MLAVLCEEFKPRTEVLAVEQTGELLDRDLVGTLDLERDANGLAVWISRPRRGNTQICKSRDRPSARHDDPAALSGEDRRLALSDAARPAGGERDFALEPHRHLLHPRSWSIVNDHVGTGETPRGLNSPGGAVRETPMSC